MTTKHATEERPTRLYDGDTFTLRGYTFRFKTERDDFMGEPWKEHDGHGIVSEWTTREKRAGERVLAEDGGSRRYYDFAETMKRARAEGWGTADGRQPGETARAYRARAVEQDFEFCRGWCRDEWEWEYVRVDLLDEDGDTTEECETLGGIESNAGAYFVEVAYELAGEILSRVEVDEPLAVRSEN